MRCAAPAFALLCLLASPALAQDFDAHVRGAIATLHAMSRLLDQVEARKSAVRPAQARPAADGWVDLFDGATLAGWTRTDYTGGGVVRVEPAFRGAPAIVVEAGTRLSGLHRTVEPPTTGYEIALESMKVQGSDFMCGLTFPVAGSHATLILGGWGGMVVGLSSIDGMDASENETTSSMKFETDRWYRVRVRVAAGRIEAWLDDRQVVDVKIGARRIGLRFGEISKSVPLGLATYQTSAAYRAIRLRTLP